MLSITASGTTRWRAVCIERCKHGSEGGAGVSSQEASRAYPTQDLLAGLGGARRHRARPERARHPAYGEATPSGLRWPKTRITSSYQRSGVFHPPPDCLYRRDRKRLGIVNTPQLTIDRFLSTPRGNHSAARARGSNRSQRDRSRAASRERCLVRVSEQALWTNPCRAARRALAVRAAANGFAI